MASIKFRVNGLDSMQAAFAKAAKGPSEHAISNFDKTLDVAFRAVRTATHVDTGKLRRSGYATSHYNGKEWEGAIYFDKNPGIFELARGSKPTKSHPEGNHHFFNAVEAFLPTFSENMDRVFEDLFNEKAPI